MTPHTTGRIFDSMTKQEADPTTTAGPAAAASASSSAAMETGRCRSRRRAGVSFLSLLLLCCLLFSPAAVFVRAQPPIRLDLIRRKPVVGSFSPANRPLSVLDRNDQPDANVDNVDSYVKIVPSTSRNPNKFVALFSFKLGRDEMAAVSRNAKGLLFAMNSLGEGWGMQRRTVQIKRWKEQSSQQASSNQRRLTLEDEEEEEEVDCDDDYYYSWDVDDDDDGGGGIPGARCANATSLARPRRSRRTSANRQRHLDLRSQRRLATKSSKTAKSSKGKDRDPDNAAFTSSGNQQNQNQPQRQKKRKNEMNYDWVKVTNNQHDPGMSWMYKEEEIGFTNGDGARYFDENGILQIRIVSNNAAEVLFLDYLAVWLRFPTVGGTRWQPRASQWLTWQWQLQGTLDRSFDVDVYDVDLFDTSETLIRSLRQDDGRIVICYFSAGTYEGWRSDWAQFFPGGTSTMPLAGDMKEWDESWLDVRQIDAIKPIMTSRMNLAKAKGCDAVEPDNMDAYANADETGGVLSYSDQLAYNRWIADAAHAVDLPVALKNDLDQFEDLVDWYDFAVNEQCHQYNECGRYDIFLAQDKAVFGVEYVKQPGQFCEDANGMKMSFLHKNLDLKAYRVGCETYPGWGAGPAPTPTTPSPPGPTPTTTTPTPGPPQPRWQPRRSDDLTWQIQLDGTLDASFDVDVYVVSLFWTSSDQIASLKAAGRKVVCHFSSGTYEEWVSDWSTYFPGLLSEIPVVAEIGPWGEWWLDISQIGKLKPIMSSRIQMAKDKGCDGIEGGVMDAYSYATNAAQFMDANDQLVYNRWIAAEAQSKGLSAGLFNDLSQASQLVNDFDFLVNSECFQWNECELVDPFLNADKAVFGMEYQGDPAQFCPTANGKGMSWMLKSSSLDAPRTGCETFSGGPPGPSPTTSTTQATPPPPTPPPPTPPPPTPPPPTTTQATPPPPTPSPPTPTPPTGDVWSPKPTDKLTWQIQLDGTISTGVNADVFVLDLHDAPQSKIDALLNNGKVVLCLFSAGTYENWRDDWDNFFDGFNNIPTVADIGGWGEWWLDISELETLKPIMQSRMDLAVSKKCTGVVPDVVDAYSYATNAAQFMDAADQLVYNRFLARQAHNRGLSVGLKNDVEQLPQLVGDFDFAVNEQCRQYSECGEYSTFTGANKAVFNLEYSGSRTNICNSGRTHNMSSIKKRTSLDAWRRGC